MMRQRLKSITSLLLVPILLITTIMLLVFSIFEEAQYVIPDVYVQNSTLSESTDGFSNNYTKFHNQKVSDDWYFDNQYFSSLIISDILQLHLSEEDKTIEFPNNEPLKIQQNLYSDGNENYVIGYNFFHHNDLLNSFYFLIEK